MKNAHCLDNFKLMAKLRAWMKIHPKKIICANCCGTDFVPKEFESAVILKCTQCYYMEFKIPKEIFHS